MGNVKKRFTTGLIIDYFNRDNINLHELIKRAMEQGIINETLLIVLPFLPPNEIGLTWEERVQSVKEAKRRDPQTRYDVWSIPPGAASSNEEYVSLVLNEIKRQYSHQDQVFIRNVLDGKEDFSAL